MVTYHDTFETLGEIERRDLRKRIGQSKVRDYSGESFIEYMYRKEK